MPDWLLWLVVGIYILPIIMLIVKDSVPKKEDKRVEHDEAVKYGLVYPETKQVETIQAKIIVRTEDLIVSEKDLMKALYIKLGKEAFRYADVIQEDVPHLDAKEFTAVIQVLK